MSTNMAVLKCIILSVFLISSTCGGINIVPEQIHLSYGVDPTRMVVTWSTMNATQTTIAMTVLALHGGPPSNPFIGTSRKFVSPGGAGHTQYIHRVTITGLSPGSHYLYKVGSKPEDVWSRVYLFKAMRAGTDWSPSIALYGDLGVSYHPSLERLEGDKNAGMYDAIFHIGDFAYQLHDGNGTVGDKFMNEIQPLAAELPYMTSPGNHENYDNFTHYKHRFCMPTDENSENLFYSFDIGPAHIISISTEYYYYLDYGLIQPFRQYYWLISDLQEANKPENRAKRPWIITMGHRPMYCSNKNWNDCTRHHSIVRDGIPVIHKFGLEKIFYDYGVDLELWAHEHSFERLWPIYDDKVYNGSLYEPYTNPKAPVHIITGSAGMRGGHDYFIPDPRPWSAFRSDDWGYTRMKIINSTHLSLQQVSDDKGGAVIDDIMIIKDKHGPYI